MDNDRKSPTQLDRRSPITPIMEDRQFTMEPTPVPPRSPIGFSQMTAITPTKSPTVPFIPPITISKPSETMAFVQKMQMEEMGDVNRIEKDKNAPKEAVAAAAAQPQPSPSADRKEKSSVMKDILAFVRKPSSKKSTSPTPPAGNTNTASSSSPAASSGTRTSRFAAAFSRTESNSGIPLLRQSTFSSSPTPSSRAAKSAVTKQLSEVSLEPKMSSRFRSLASSTKISLRLRRSGTSSEKKDKKSSGDDLSDADSASESRGKERSSSSVKSTSEKPSGSEFDMEAVKFDKVGESYPKHEQIREETFEESSPSAKSTYISAEQLLDIGNPSHPVKKSKTSDDEINSNNIRVSVENLKRSLQNLLGGGHHHKEEKSNKDDDPRGQNHKDNNGNIPGEGAAAANGAIGMDTLKCGAGGGTIQCPTFEIEPPSRRASFDPPRSPYLESLRSPGDTDTTTRFDSGGESFEIVDTDRNRESSFEDRYSSMDTSFDISRYHSTSYEDQTSSFEMVETAEGGREKKSSIDLRKSSIELVDVETFQQRGGGVSSGGVSNGGASRKSSLETHFDYMRPERMRNGSGSGSGGGGGGPAAAPPGTGRHYLKHSGGRGKSSMMRSHFSGAHRPKSPLSQQTSSNYSSRDSYDSGSDYYAGSAASRSPFLASHSHCHGVPPRKQSIDSAPRSPYEGNRQHFPMAPKSPNEPQQQQQQQQKGFICTDTRCAAIFEPRPPRVASPYLSCSSGNEFEPPSPRRASSASPKHTFTFRIVLKKMESSPDNIGLPAGKDRKSRIERHKRRDSRRKRLQNENGKKV